MINNYPRPQARARAVVVPFELWIQLRLRRTRIPGRTRFPRGRLEGAVIVYSRRYNLYGHLCGRIYSADSILGYDILLFPSVSFYLYCFSLSLSLSLLSRRGLLEVSGWLGAPSIGAPQHPSKLFKLRDMVGGPSASAPQPLCARDLGPASLFLSLFLYLSLFLCLVFTAR